MKNIKAVCKKSFENLPEKVMQFGEGNFLRAFADWYIEDANRSGVFNGRVVIVQPRAGGHCERINAEDSFYTILMRGRHDGKIVNRAERISSVSRCVNPFSDYNRFLELAKSDDLAVVISNTTEAGIEYIEGERLEDSPNVSYPAKLTVFLFERFREEKPELLILPVELIENNGKALKECVLKYANDWEFGSEFISYIENECRFCSTLVDRIVTGFPSENYAEIANELKYDDPLLVVSEPYISWIIEGNQKWAKDFPIHETGANVIWTNDLTPYRTRKVRILNGAHTMSVFAAYFCGIDIVRDMMHDDLLMKYLKKGIYDEVIKTIDMPKDELISFANSVFERFDNPYIDHKLLDISLNSVSKYRARCLPSLLDYVERFHKIPSVLSFGLASLLCFYKGKYIDGRYMGMRNNAPYEIKDSDAVCSFFVKACNNDDYVKAVLKNVLLWGEDLTKTQGLEKRISEYYNLIQETNMRNAIEKVVNNE